MIDVLELTPGEYDAFVSAPFAGERLAEAPSLIVVDAGRRQISSPGALPVVVCALGEGVGRAGPRHADLVVDAATVPSLAARVATNPIAATTLVLLLRSIERLDVDAGLVAESTAYSMLQGGEEFARWRGTVPPEVEMPDGATVLVERDGSALTITLNRPHRHNAVSRALRDELCSALEIATLDDSISAVRLLGAGPSFCSGGDLAEFGARADPAAAHLTRLAQSPARLLHRIRDRTTVQIHGATLGGGIEMAAFAGRLIAHPDTRIGLPEVDLGLIPGAGGTVSISRRAGRQRTAALALAIDSIDADTALAWGLVDEIEPR